MAKAPASALASDEAAFSEDASLLALAAVDGPKAAVGQRQRDASGDQAPVILIHHAWDAELQAKAGTGFSYRCGWRSVLRCDSASAPRGS